eukprot:27613_1
MKVTVLLTLFITQYDANELFNCGGESNIQIPLEYVNDNYCDCMETGFDEMDTSACNNGKFLCEKDNKHIHSSLVNDGICDCSDGSDEWLFDSKCNKYNNKINHIENDFNVFTNVINTMKLTYSNITFPSYVISKQSNDNNNIEQELKESKLNDYANIKDVHQILKKKKQTKTKESVLKETHKLNKKTQKSDESFPYDKKYKPPPHDLPPKDIDNELMELMKEKQQSYNSYSKWTVLTLFAMVIAVSASVSYFVKFKYFDKSKQH